MLIGMLKKIKQRYIVIKSTQFGALNKNLLYIFNQTVNNGKTN